jgi:hypothetical protein
MSLAYCIWTNPYKNCILFIKRGEKKFSIVLENFCVFFFLPFFLIYNKLVKFLKDLTNISIILKHLIPEN